MSYLKLLSQIYQVQFLTRTKNRRIKIQTISISVVFFCFIFSCSNKIPGSVKENMELAGSNSRELRKVIKHYRKEQDSLKLKAAYYLIKNMKYHGFYEIEDETSYDILFDSIGNYYPERECSDDFFNFILRSKLVDDMVDKYLSAYSLGRYKGEYHPDLQFLNADFLIENIEYAFKAWELPWSKCYDFDEFCKYILPYRYGSEAPERWRKEFYEEFKWIADSTSNAITAIKIMNNLFRNEIATSHTLKTLANSIKVKHLYNGKVVESCEGQTGLGVCILRSIGIPVTTIVIPWWGNRAVGHKMNALLDSSKQWQYFAFDDWDPSNEVQDFAPKMFLYHFNKLPDSITNYHPFLLDAGNSFQNTKTIRLDIEYDEEIQLGLFGDRAWVPIAQGQNDHNGIVFNNIGIKDYMYISGTFNNNSFYPASYPFTVDSTGVPNYFIPDTTKRFSFEIDRKYPPKDRDIRCEALIGGTFQVSDDPDFKTVKTVYTINEGLRYGQNIFDITPIRTKNIRFVFPPDSGSCENGPAEISFFSSNLKDKYKVHGKYNGSTQLSDKHIKIMTDEDVLTYVEWRTFPNLVGIQTDNVIIKEYERDTIWFGVELDTLTKITHLGICPRNDKNNIYPGMYYELLFWDNKWKSLGVQEARGETIIFNNIPSNAVFWLRNHSEGREERIFTIENGEQIWW